MQKLNEMESGENANILQTLRSLVAMNENLKKQEQQFRVHCKVSRTFQGIKTVFLLCIV